MKKIIVIFILIFSINLMAQEAKIGGVYEAGIGATDEKRQIAYFERFGYRVGKTGAHSAKEAEKLYGVKSKL